MHNEKWLFEVALGILYSTSKAGENTAESERARERAYVSSMIFTGLAA